MARTATAGRAKDQAEDKAREVAASPWTERLIRLGYIARGIVYIVPGLLALGLAIGSGGAVVNQTSAIEMMGAWPFGKPLLVVVAIGLAGYAAWGLIRATLDPLHEGDDAEGLLKRAGYIVSGLGYAVLLIATIQYLMGLAVSGNNPQDWSAKLLAQPLGRVVVGAIGLAWIIGGGLRQIYDAIKKDFKKDLKTGRMSPQERALAISAGRFGLAARGIVFGLIGLFLVKSAVFVDPAKAQGLDGALLAVARTPYGPWLLAIVALGLVAFGVYSVMCARWMRVNVPRHG